MDEEEWAGPPKDTRVRPCPGCAIIGWMLGVTAAMATISLLMWLDGKGAGAFGAFFFALIATLPLLVLRAILGRGRGAMFATIVGAGAGLIYGALFHGMFEPMTQRAQDQDGSITLIFVLAGAVAGAVWWAVEWLARE